LKEEQKLQVFESKTLRKITVNEDFLEDVKGTGRDLF
jgi:hypothetical protein